jgi:hypothetical protein
MPNNPPTIVQYIVICLQSIVRTSRQPAERVGAEGEPADAASCSDESDAAFAGVIGSGYMQVGVEAGICSCPPFYLTCVGRMH